MGTSFHCIAVNLLTNYAIKSIQCVLQFPLFHGYLYFFQYLFIPFYILLCENSEYEMCEYTYLYSHLVICDWSGGCSFGVVMVVSNLTVFGFWVM